MFFIGSIENSALIEVEFSVNSLPHQFLSKIFFQQKHFKKYTKEMDNGEIDKHYYYVRPISEILTCLELMGSTLDKIRSAYIQELRLYKQELNLYKPEPNYYLKDKFYSSFYEEFIPDKKGNMQLEVDTFFNEIKLVSIENFIEFNPDKYPETDFHSQDMTHNFSDFGLFFHKTMLDKYGKNLGKFHLYFLTRLNSFDFTQFISINDSILKQYLILDYTDLVDSGYCSESPLKDDDIRNIGRLEKFLIITEGSSDTEIINRSMNTLRPHCSIFFDYINMKKDYPFTGTGNLVNFIKGLIKINVFNKIMILFDNDTEGLSQYNKLQELSLPDNITIKTLPELDDMNDIKTIGTSGEERQNINGKACSIECFLDLNYKVKEGPAIRWTNYNESLKQYHGSLINRKIYVKSFIKAHNNNFSDKNKKKYNTKKIEYLLNYIIQECSILASKNEGHLESRILTLG